MSRIPLTTLRFLRMTPGDEGDRLYCYRCVRSQSLGIIALSLIGSIGLAAHWGNLAVGIAFSVWAVAMMAWAGTHVWSALRRPAKHARLPIPLSPNDKNRNA